MKAEKKTLLSIIIPIYQVEEYIEECITSITENIESYGEEVEVILVDDGSKDESGKIADWYAECSPYIHVIHKENAGVAAARNTGLSVSRGEWIYFVDSDDYLDIRAIRTIIMTIKQAGEAQILLFDGVKEYFEGTSLVRSEKWEHFPKSFRLKNKEKIEMLCQGILYFPTCQPKTKVPLSAPWDKVFKRSFLVEKNLQFPERLKVLDDMVFNLKAFQEAKEIVYRKAVIYHYRFVADSITNQYKEDRFEKDIQVFEDIQEYMENNMTEKRKENLQNSFYLRIIKSFAIGLTLSIFHSKNKVSYWEKRKECQRILSSPFYEEAFSNVKVTTLEWKLKLVYVMVKCKNYLGLYLLSALQRMQKRRVS